MNRIVTGILLIASLSIIVGCDARSSAKDQRRSPTPTPLSPPACQIPEEYQVLATTLALEMRTSPDEFRNGISDSELISEISICIMNLDGINSDDTDILSLTKCGSKVFHDILGWKDRFDALPKTSGIQLGAAFIQSLAISAIGGAYGGATGDFKTAMEMTSSSDWWKETRKVDAIFTELNNYSAILNRAHAIPLMLPQVAKKYAAKESDSQGRITVDIDESWGWDGPHDWFRICNSGPDTLENCTIQVELIGGNGESRKNVHYVRHWPTNLWMHARYDQGIEFPGGKRVAGTTVTKIPKAVVSLWSPSFTTTMTYVYQGNEKDRDVARRCENLNFSGRYQPFQSGILWNTERGVEFELGGS